MALNKYMHARNLYRTPPNFEKLSTLFTEFAAISKVDVTGKISIDFKDPHSLRVLTKCLLKSDFNLDVDIPNNRLVPTLPLRLNYILWIEDLMSAIHRNDHVWGLDIGTGACAIYPLLAGIKNKWNMMGTEIDEESFIKAEENIKRNNLQGLIKLRINTTKSIISHMFTNEDQQNFDFCVCNPPFYSTLEELCESRSPARLPPKNAFTGSPQELITEGGELKFCRKLIEESKQFRMNILIFTTMVGHKYNLIVLIQDLRSAGIRYTHTEFCQGRVTRWGLAWTFNDYDLYDLVPPRDKPRKKQSPIIYHLPDLPKCTYNTDVALNNLKKLLNGLDIHYKVLDKRGSNVSLDIIAYTNTWSNQRRKRRLMKKMETEAKKIKLDSTIDCTPITSVRNEVKSIEVVKNTSNVLKSHIKSITQSPDKFQLGGSSNENSDRSVHPSEDKPLVHASHSSEDKPLVHAFFKLVKKENNNLLEIEFLDGSAGKEGLHQIVQYIKNNWK